MSVNRTTTPITTAAATVEPVLIYHYQAEARIGLDLAIPPNQPV